MSGFDLSAPGHVALITDADAALGQAVAEVFGDAGYRLVLAGGDAARDLADRLTTEGVEVAHTAVDWTVEAQIAGAVETALERWRRLDFVFNDTELRGPAGPIEELAAADLDRVLAVSVEAPLLVCKHAVPAMRERGGSILNLASIAVEKGTAHRPAFAAAKAGVVSLTRGLARNAGRAGVRLNCLSPGSLEGEVAADEIESRVAAIPLGRLGRPRDVACLALFLASPLAAHIHGAVLTIDGGETLGYH